jgi:hypothetical protein
MLKLDMGGKIIPGTAQIEQEDGGCSIYAQIEGCCEYPDDTISCLIARTGDPSIAKLILSMIEKRAAAKSG